MRKPRVLLADDHTLLTDGIKKLLEPRYELVGTVADGRSLLEAAKTLRPDVVLLDISMPLLNGVDAARRLKKGAPEIKLVFLTMHADRTYVSEAFKAGASGYVVKTSAAEELLFALDQVLKGGYYVTPAVARGVVEASLRPPEKEERGAALTPRQREVLQLVAEGKSIKEIATILDISVKTVDFHKARICEELGLRTTAELTRYAVAHGIVSV